MHYIGVDYDKVIFHHMEGFVFNEKVPGSFHHIEKFCEGMTVHGGVPVFFVACLGDIDETGGNPFVVVVDNLIDNIGQTGSSFPLDM